MNIKSKAFLAYIVIFLVGGASGFFLNEAISPGFHRQGMERGPGMNREMPPQWNGKISERMQDFIINRLDLRDDQVEPFFEIQSKHLQSLFERMGEHKEEESEILRQMYSEFVDDVDEILTEEQLAELNSFAHPDSVRHNRMQRRERQEKFR